MTSYGTEPIPVAPYSLDLLADLHAGALSDSVSDQLWPLVRQDAEAMEIISALDAVSARLGTESLTPSSGEPIPPEVAERLDRALAAAELPAAELPATGLPAVTPTTAAATTAAAAGTHASSVAQLGPRRRTSRTAIGVGIAAAVAVAIGVVSAVVIGIGTTGSSEDLRADAPTLVLDSVDLDASLAYNVMATRGSAPLFDSGNVSECLVANGFQPGSSILGAAPIELDGRDGVILVIAKDLPDAGMTLLAVTPDCGADNPGTLARTDVA